MLQISPLQDVTKAEFEKLFCEYYRELGCDDDCAHLLKEYILPDLLAGLIKIDILKNDGLPSGFIIYQIDGIENDWNFKEGWGDIREIYVAPTLRRSGAGMLLLYTAEMRLKESGAQRAYALPAEGSIPFFEKCGYIRTEEYNAELDCPVYIKEELNKKCK